MGDIIQLLPDSIANQIAAGEVVQRPASVVKELMENSIDAGSTSITLLVKDAGKALIQVIDDGVGMSLSDARLSFERHATSKIRKSEDLFKIHTMGFRGEALASIAAVAQVELKTKREADELGTKICIEASKLTAQEAIACKTGTSLCVKNLFFNVPARRNFLKSNPVEMRHILDEFHRVSLAHPEIEFSLFHNDLEVYHLMPGKLSSRIVAIFGKNYQKQLASCEESTPLIQIQGYIGRPENAKKSKGQQFFFVNTRYIRHPYLHHAVMNAFEGLIPADTYPFYVLFLEIDPVHIDINIHPTKTEVKFDDERSIYAIVQAAVRKALSMHNLSPSLDFDVDVNASANTQHFKTAIQENKLYQGTGTKAFSQPQFSQKKSTQNWESFYENLKKSVPEENPDFEETTEKPMPLTLQSKANQLSGNTLFSDEPQTRKNFQVHNQFIISQVQSGILMIHQKAARERILFDQYMRQLQNQRGLSQRLLFPKEIVMEAGDFQLLLEIDTEIRNLGFIFDVLPKQRILLKGIPTEVIHENEQELFEGFLEQFKNFQSSLTLDKHALLARSLAKRAAHKISRTLNPSEMNALIDQLFASTNPNFAPDGHPCFIKLSLQDIAELFVKK